MRSDDTDSPPGELGQEAAARALRDAVRQLIVAHGMLEPGRRPCGMALPTPHAWALLELLEAGELTVTELATRLNIDRTNVSRLCKRMASQGELERLAHPTDGRARLVTLTERGRHVARAVDHSSAGHFAHLVERLGARSPGIADALVVLARAMAGATEDSGDPR